VDLSDVLEEAEQIQILTTLSRLTTSGTLTWASDGAYASVTSGGNHRYTLSAVDRDGEPPYQLTIERRERREGSRTIGYRTIGVIVMRQTSDEKSNAEVNSLLRQLYESAFRQSRRKISNISDVIDELSGIERGDIPPF
jgi:hypothetical protein